MEAQWMVILVHEITLGHGQHLCRWAGEKSTIGAHLVCFRIHLHTRCCPIQNHGTLADFASVGDRKKLLCKPKVAALLHQSLADKRDRTFRHRSTESAEHRPV